ncbi:MAG: hypothetical protein JSW34_05925, partial [Candidatus Zixiibacteriota bacterium]
MRASAISQLTAVLVLICLAFSSQAEVPRTISYQGRLTDSEGLPAADDDYLVTFSIYDVLSGGTALWTSGQQTVPITDGLFSYLLGSNVNLPDDLFSTDTLRWLGIKVADDPEIAPRTKLTSVAYSYHALSADVAAYAISGPGSGHWALTGNVLHPVGEYALSSRGSNIFYGAHDSTHVNLGIACTTGTAGEDFKYSTVAGGCSNAASGG